MEIPSESLPNTKSTHEVPETRAYDNVVIIGYVLLAVSAMLYALQVYTGVPDRDESFSTFILHYLLALAYAVLLTMKGAYGIVRCWKKEHIDKTIILLNLFLVSAYALNRVIPVFEESADWLCVYLVLSSAVILSCRYFDRLPTVVNKLQYLLLGSAMVLFVYMTLFVGEYYLIGAVGILLFGIGTHILMPLLLVVASGVLIKHTYQTKQVSYYWIMGGAGLTVAYAAAFMIEWNVRVKAIERLANQSVIYADTELPVWTKVGQSVKNDWITLRILKSDLVYTIPSDRNFGFLPRSAAWSEARKHDPLIFLATLNSKCTLSEEDRVKILQAITDSRHRAEERLWPGGNLTTSYIVTDVDIFPDLRLAYTEKYLNIRNSRGTNRWWRPSEEAIYTFQLPEGSVVTSLSLWVNGREEKAILTSKQNAVKAYTTIVGREMRDPSVVHWQEGNTVSVRVFPCTSDEERKFKLGITSPLPEKDGRILYESVSFRGPDANAATETSRIRFIGGPVGLSLPDMYKRNEKGEYISEHAYDPELIVSFNAQPLKKNSFSFDGFTYSILPYHPVFQSVALTEIFLDINRSWTDKDLLDLRPLLDEYNLYAYDAEQFVKIDQHNWDAIATGLVQRNFSLFPFHHIKDTGHSLVITKGEPLSPYLRDFKESGFAKGISEFFAANKKVYVYNLSGGASTYIRSFKELRGLEFAEGSADQLLHWLNDNKFPKTNESEESVVLHDAKMMIAKKPESRAAADNAPDHLARLFTYNNIMRNVGAHYFENDFVSEALVDQATTAYVVSPVSSLIVLETQQDYQRFGIKDKDNSLHNASKQSSGAVPEPHEWALIMLFILLVFCTIARNYKRTPAI